MAPPFTRIAPDIVMEKAADDAVKDQQAKKGSMEHEGTCGREGDRVVFPL
jgi:hypothetical protein